MTTRSPRSTASTRRARISRSRSARWKRFTRSKRRGPRNERRNRSRAGERVQGQDHGGRAEARAAAKGLGEPQDQAVLVRRRPGGPGGGGWTLSLLPKPRKHG